ncbi:phage protein Gp27 family protein [Candidatus Binatus sp.]|uniref:phage protein Gp27 family protein n=1 Tax=Candidatus Binatus sp. TaxID=2811406 RepID=UPI003C3D0907
MKKEKDGKKENTDGHPKRVPYQPLPPKTWKIKRMARDLKEQLDALLREGTMHTSLQLQKWLADNGFEISRRCIDDYRHNFERQLDSVRLATEQARMVCEQFKGDDAQMQGALLRLVQTRLFEILVVAKEKETSRKKRTSPTVAAVNVGALARCVSGLVKAETEHQKWAEHMRAGVAAVAQKVEEARDKGLSKEAADQIKAVLMEI